MSSECNAEENRVVVPQHVAIIMDGNGRWAKSRHLPRVEGHRQGAKTVRMVIEESRRIGIKYLTLFAFSSENWSRPQEEVSTLMKLLQHYLEREVMELAENGVRLKAIGDLGRLPDSVQKALVSATEVTAKNDSLNLTLAVSYGGRDEILHVIRQIALKVERGELSSNGLDINTVRSFLYDPDLPDIDLLIRTSGENRISNFMLWQLAYSEIVIDTVYWPDFSKERYQLALAEFSRRSRRFGKTQEQIS